MGGPVRKADLPMSFLLKITTIYYKSALRVFQILRPLDFCKGTVFDLLSQILRSFH